MLVFRARSCHATSQNPQDSGFGRFMIPLTARFAVGESHEPTARFRPALEKIIDLRHPLVRLAGTIDLAASSLRENS
jgi:hypothetical protein